MGIQGRRKIIKARASFSSLSLPPQQGPRLPARMVFVQPARRRGLAGVPRGTEWPHSGLRYETEHRHRPISAATSKRRDEVDSGLTVRTSSASSGRGLRGRRRANVSSNKQSAGRQGEVAEGPKGKSIVVLRAMQQSESSPGQGGECWNRDQGVACLNCMYY